jgi:protein-serine/threonine kinase
MSSATLQPPAHQQTSLASLGTPPLISASPSSRPYGSTSGRDPNYASPQSQASSPSASVRRPSNRPGATSAPSPMGSRTAMSPQDANYSAEIRENTERRERRHKNQPPVAPPRTSSNQHTPSSSSMSASRRQGGSTSDRAGDVSQQLADAGNGDGQGQYQPEIGEAPQSSRSRRHHPGSHEIAERSSRNREAPPTSNSTSLPVRSANHSTQNSTRGPSRETSEILKSVMISSPEEDIARERERLALAQTEAGLPDDESVQSPNASAVEPHEEGTRRGGRSRHDHSGKREKHTKFGEYILGNTIGEGEFGKVKLGWKPEGGVQVRLALILLAKK